MSEKSRNSNESSGKRGGKQEKTSSTKSNPPPTTITDLKLTILTNTILICVIAYLTKEKFIKQDVYRDCGDYYARGHRQDGVYTIRPGLETSPSVWWSFLSTSPADERGVDVYCNMTAGGLTLLFRKHFQSSTQFQVGIETYKNGFGDLNGDFFLGLETISKLTRNHPRQLIAVLNNTQYRYDGFRVLNEFHHYKFIVNEEFDRLADDATLLKLNNTLFSTFDLDFDMAANSNCSSGWNAGWWFTDCFDHTACMTCSYVHSNAGLKTLDYAAFLIK